MEEQVDLRIVEHLDMQNLPESIQTMLSLAKTDEERGSEYYSDKTDAALYCKNEDYETAEVIGLDQRSSIARRITK